MGLLAGAALDQLIPDPRRGHPVALFGTIAGALEAAAWRDDRRAGMGYGALLAGGAAALGAVIARAPGRWVAASACTWVVLGGRSLAVEASAVKDLLAHDDLHGARRRLTHLVGRRTEQLDDAEIARATIESLAENTCDAVVAPLFWGAVAGIPGLLGYRAVNTLDAMVGHHSNRYENFGWASARADDVANYVPARITALLTAAVAPVVSGDCRAVLTITRRDGRSHPSPNSGMSEAAFAGALGIRLGGRNDYGSYVEDRPVLGGSGRPPQAIDIARATRLCRVVTSAAALVLALVALIPRPAR